MRARINRLGRGGIVGGVLLGALAACATTSPPMRFYVLTAVSGAGNNIARAAGSGAQSDARGADIRVQHVSIPGELDRPQIVRGVAGNRLDLSEQDRWAAPLDEMIRRVLNQDLGRDDADGNAGAADGAQGGNSGAPRNVALEIDEFMPAADCSVSLRATWTVSNSAAPGGATNAGPGANAASGAAVVRPASRGTIALRTASPSNACAAGDVPAAMSAALGQLGEQLRAAIAKSAQPTAARG